MEKVGVHTAKKRFSKLLARVSKGEHFTITRYGVPVAQLRPIHGPSRRSMADVIAELEEFRCGKRLEGSSIKELIEEGRM